PKSRLGCSLIVKLGISAIPLLLTPIASGQPIACSVSSLNGDYAFTISGQIMNADGTVTTHNGVAMAHYDGNGNWTQLDYVASLTPSQHPPGGIDTAPAFRLGESGTYIVNPNCSGSAEMVFAPPPSIRTGAVIKLMFVLSDQGRVIHAVMSSIT